MHLKKPMAPQREVAPFDLAHHKAFAALWIVLSIATFSVLFLNLSSAFTDPELTGSIVKDDSLGGAPHIAPHVAITTTSQGGLVFYYAGFIGILVVIAAGFYTRFHAK